MSSKILRMRCETGPKIVASLHLTSTVAKCSGRLITDVQNAMGIITTVDLCDDV